MVVRAVKIMPPGVQRSGPSKSGIVDRLPDLQRRERHIEMSHAEGRECVHDSADDGWWRTETPGLPRTLGAERVGWRRRGLVDLEREARHVVGTRQRIVHQRGRQELASIVIDNGFTESLGNALGNAAVELPMDDHWMDGCTDIM